MPKKVYPLKLYGPKRLELSWESFWKNISIKLDSKVIGTIPGKKELESGQSFLLPDNSTLQIQLVRRLFSSKLSILYNGKPVPGSAFDPSPRLKTAYTMIFFVAVFSLILAFRAMVLQNETLQHFGVGFGSVIIGVTFLILGFFTVRQSIIALIAAIVLYTLDSIIAVYFAIQSVGQLSSIFLIAPRILFLILMIRGVGAIKELHRQER